MKRKKIEEAIKKIAYGVGYKGFLSNGNVPTKSKYPRQYKMWYSMMQRGYDAKFKKKYPTYKDVYVDEKLHNFAYFVEYVYPKLVNENNFPRTMTLQLDKDILKKGNKVYSEDTIILVPKKLNLMFTKRDESRGNLPIGVVYHKNNKTKPYIAFVKTGIIPPNHKTSYRLSKGFKTPEEAFQYYKQEKERIIRLTAVQYRARGFITENSRLFKALMNYKVEINDWYDIY